MNFNACQSKPSASTSAEGAPGASVSLQRVSKAYDRVLAVKGCSLDVSPGEVLTLLGPSGSGKTTLLMIIAGFVGVSSGEVLISNRRVTDLPPEQRGVGVVFQHYALFPHMSVAENIGFPLRMRGVARGDIRKRVAAALDLVRMTQLGERFPSQLSGGQQQRVALARATVFGPPLLLLDEPLGALDKKLRESMQIELKELHRKLRPTMIHVTHDQSEALSLSDRVAVINDGRIEQLGRPSELYERPSTRFVAEFMGESNTFRGRARSLSGRGQEVETRGGLPLIAQACGNFHFGQEVSIVTRPDRIVIGVEAEGMPNAFVGRLQDASYVGEFIKYRISISPLEEMTVNISARSRIVDDIEVGTDIQIGWLPQDCLLFPEM